MMVVASFILVCENDEKKVNQKMWNWSSEILKIHRTVRIFFNNFSTNTFLCQRCHQTETENRMNLKALWVKCLTVNL